MRDKSPYPRSAKRTKIRLKRFSHSIIYPYNISLIKLPTSTHSIPNVVQIVDCLSHAESELHRV